MPKKKLGKGKLNATDFEQASLLFEGDLLSCLDQFTAAFGTEERTQMYARLRAVFAPLDNSRYYDFSSLNLGTYNTYDPTVWNTIDRAVSSMMSYHLNPKDKFFKYKDIDVKSLVKKKEKVTEAQELSLLTEYAHYIYQAPSNFEVETMIQRDKLIFGVGIKTLDNDDQIVTRFEHYQPEDFGGLSSNAVDKDVLITRRRLTDFQARNKFIDTITVRDDLFGESASPLDLGLHDSGYYYYRLNIPYEVLMKSLQAIYKGDSMEKQFMAYVHHIFGTADNEYYWVDLWFSRKGLLTSERRRAKTIINSMCIPPNSNSYISKGLGERALPLAIVLADLGDINISGYERTFAPTWAISNEAKLSGVNLTRDGIVYYETPEAVPKSLSLAADVRAMAEFHEYYSTVYKNTFYLDVFELLNKSRMTTSEVDARLSDNFRKLGLIVIQDESDNLQPTAMALRENLVDNADLEADAAGRVLRSEYISPIAIAHRNSSLEQTQLMMQTLGAVGKIRTESPELKKEIDFDRVVSDLFRDTDNTRYLLNEDEKDKLKQEEEELRKNNAAEQKAKALGEITKAEDALKGAQDGNPARPVQAGGQTQQGQPQQALPQQPPQ